MKRLMVVCLIIFVIIPVSVMSQPQQKPPRPVIEFDPVENPDIDMYIAHWRTNRPYVTHGELLNWDIFTRGKHIDPPYQGAVLEYMKSLTYAKLMPGSTTTPVTPQGEQEIFYVISGTGIVKGGGETLKFDKGGCMLLPEGMEFTITNTGDDYIEFIHVVEPTREGFKPNDHIVLHDEDTFPLQRGGHGGNFEKILLYYEDGIAEFELWVKWTSPLMNSGFHPHTEGWEHIEVAIENNLTFFLGNEIRSISPGGAYMVPPNGKVEHCDFNVSDKAMKFIFIVRKPYEQRLEKRPGW